MRRAAAPAGRSTTPPSALSTTPAWARRRRRPGQQQCRLECPHPPIAQRWAPPSPASRGGLPCQRHYRLPPPLAGEGGVGAITDEARMTDLVDGATLRRWLGAGGEIAFIDVREEGQHGDGHPLLAVNAPYSRLELEIGRLVPRRSCRLVLADDDDGVADKAARRLVGLGYSDVHVLSGGVAAWAAGYPLFPSANVPSKAFAELVEIDRHTPHVT